MCKLLKQLDFPMVFSYSYVEDNDLKSGMNVANGKKIVTHSRDETFQFGFNLASGLKSRTIIALIGPLGAGKTTLAQGLGAGLGIVAVAVKFMYDRPEWFALNIIASGILLTVGGLLRFFSKRKGD